MDPSGSLLSCDLHLALSVCTSSSGNPHIRDCVISAVRFACRSIHWHFEGGIGGIPWSLPGSHTGLEHVDDAIGDFLRKSRLAGLGTFGALHLIWIRWRSHGLQLSSPAWEKSFSGSSL